MRDINETLNKSLECNDIIEEYNYLMCDIMNNNKEIKALNNFLSHTTNSSKRVSNTWKYNINMYFGFYADFCNSNTLMDNIDTITFTHIYCKLNNIHNIKNKIKYLEIENDKLLDKKNKLIELMKELEAELSILDSLSKSSIEFDSEDNMFVNINYSFIHTEETIEKYKYIQKYLLENFFVDSDISQNLNDNTELVDIFNSILDKNKIEYIIDKYEQAKLDNNLSDKYIEKIIYKLNKKIK